MVVVDTHCHASLDWYEPIETLLYQMDSNGVDHAVLVQIMGQFDNEYQFACTRRYPGRFANVVLVDAERPDAPEQLERLAERGSSGVRLRPTTRSPGDDPLAIWRTADRLGLAVSCGGSSADFASDEFSATVQAFPGLRIVIEHLGSVSRRDVDEVQSSSSKCYVILRRNDEGSVPDSEQSEWPAPAALIVAGHSNEVAVSFHACDRVPGEAAEPSCPAWDRCTSTSPRASRMAHRQT